MAGHRLPFVCLYLQIMPKARFKVEQSLLRHYPCFQGWREVSQEDLGKLHPVSSRTRPLVQCQLAFLKGLELSIVDGKQVLEVEQGCLTRQQESLVKLIGNSLVSE